MSRLADRLEIFLWHRSQILTLNCFEIKALKGSKRSKEDYGVYGTCREFE